MSAFLRKYAVATHVYIPVIKRAVVDFAVGADWTPAAGDVKISIDGGAVANIATLPVAIASGNGAFWDYALSSGEVTGKKMIITTVDAATKAVEDQSFCVETYGNASAEHPFDLGTATQKVDVDTIKTNPVVNGGTITFPTTATLASTTNITAGTITTATNLTNAPTAGDFTATMKTSLNAATPAVTVSDKTGFSLTAAYDPAKTASQAGDAMALTGGERTTLAGVINTTAIVESYRANGAVPTPAQFMSEVLAHLGESSISGTTKTVKKLDHSTTAATFTLDSAVTPAAITRAT